MNIPNSKPEKADILSTSAPPEASAFVPSTSPKAHYDSVKMKYFMSLGMNRQANPSNNNPNAIYSQSVPKSTTLLDRERTKTTPVPVIKKSFEDEEQMFQLDKEEEVTKSDGINIRYSEDKIPFGHRKKRSVSSPMIFGMTTPMAIPSNNYHNGGGNTTSALTNALNGNKIPTSGHSIHQIPIARTNSGGNSNNNNNSKNLANSDYGSSPSFDDNLIQNDSEEEDSELGPFEPNPSQYQRRASLEKKRYEEVVPESFVGGGFIPPHEMLRRQQQQSDAFDVGTAKSVAVWEQKRRNMANV